MSILSEYIFLPKLWTDQEFLLILAKPSKHVQWMLRKKITFRDVHNPYLVSRLITSDDNENLQSGIF
ncbi:hypothetical protein DCAR_0519050 [Daucus carota subsp. sativus]|uniref:Uncharacterized protein n=1 Tax=Daucus carota subsp. sativus TaxID=79200 RepID=A0A161ZYK3_DAUCS|nr:hypothetical protein DCAR_0519050 [Daucus carota subsp. sativus]